MASSLEVSFLELFFKGQGHVIVNKPIISRIYIVVHTWPLCSADVTKTRNKQNKPVTSGTSKEQVSNKWNKPGTG